MGQGIGDLDSGLTIMVLNIPLIPLHPLLFLSFMQMIRNCGTGIIKSLSSEYLRVSQLSDNVVCLERGAPPSTLHPPSDNITRVYLIILISTANDMVTNLNYIKGCVCQVMYVTLSIQYPTSVLVI